MTVCKYQIVENEYQAHAGSKAVQDVRMIAEALDFRPLNLTPSFLPDRTPAQKVKAQAEMYHSWKQIARTVEDGSIVLLQRPFHHRQLGRERVLADMKNRGVRLICFIHDIEELREYHGDDRRAYYDREFRTMAQSADILIVHNEEMKRFLVEDKGIPAGKLVCLEMFDYLCGSNSTPVFSRSLNIAGNLDFRKSAYLREIGTLGIPVHLFGPGMPECAENVTYEGVFPPEQAALVLKEGFGLVWDGASLDTCSGPYGSYLRVNCPHKLALYLAAGIPVVIWRDAAMAPWVEQQECGLCVSSLKEVSSLLEQVQEEDYRRYALNAARAGELLRSGYHTQKALRQALDLLK